MKKTYLYLFFILFVTALGLQSCKDDDVVKGAMFSLSRDGEEVMDFSFGYGQGHIMVALASNTDWTLTSDQEWCTLSNVSGVPTDEQYIKISYERNTEEQARKATITMNAGGNIKQYTITQGSKYDLIYPEGMEKDAVETAKAISLGWNLGNTLEAPDGETSWGAPITTQEIINKVKDLGFNAVRIPCAWNQPQYLEADGKTISSDWMNHVKEIVDYCINADMYAIVNIHWDGGWQDQSCDASTLTPDSIATVEAKVYDFWTQIATAFRDYDGRLLFAGANEPAVANREDMAVLQRYEQAFVNAVRNTGGNNTYRNLIVQGPDTNIDKTYDWFELPEDPTTARLMVEVHYYVPYNFCINDPSSELASSMTYFWGEPYEQYALEYMDGKFDYENQEGYVHEQMNKMKTKFTSQGVPVIIGEFGISYRVYEDDPNLKDYKNYDKIVANMDMLQEKCEESEGYFLGYVAEQAKNYGAVPFLWDIQGARFFDRNTLEVVVPVIHEMLIEGAAKGQYPY